MIAVEEDSADEVEAVLKSHDVNPVPFGHLIPRTDVLIRVL